MTGREGKLSWKARAEEVSFKVLPKRCNRRTISYKERERVPKDRGILTETIYLPHPTPCPQPLPFTSLSLKTPAKTVPPTPGTALQHKIETNLEKTLDNSLNAHLQQQMGSFQASMLQASVAPRGVDV